MHRWCSAVLVLVLVLLWGTLGGAQALNPNDNFDNGVLDSAKWCACANNGSVEETDGKLVLTINSTDTGQYVAESVWSRYWLRGPFDIQVDYTLLEWPAHNGALFALEADPQGDYNALERDSGPAGEWDGTDEVYAAVFSPYTLGWDIGALPTADRAGKLRLVRDADNVLSGYCWDESAQQWALVHSRQVSGDDVQVKFEIWGAVLPPRVVAAFDNFQVNSGEVAPALSFQDVQIDRGRNTDWWDSARYHQRMTVQVKGSEHDTPACLVVEDTDGSRYVMSTCNPGGWYDWVGSNGPGFSVSEQTVGPDYTYTFTWYEGRKWRAPAAGPYWIAVYGWYANEAVMTTPPAPAVPEEGPVLTGPAVDSVIDTTTPTFEWLPLPGEENLLQLRAEGAENFTGLVADDQAEIWRASVNGKLAAVYNFYGSDPGPDLEPGRSYFWQVNSWTPVDDRVSDPIVSIWDEQTAQHRFTVDTDWPALPELPGRLAYGQTEYGDASRSFDVEAIAQYGSTLEARKWIGPFTSESPDFSWDGTKLQYRVCDSGTWIDSLDGSAPMLVPGNSSWADSSFSPDATRILYAEATDPNWTLDAYTQRVDGADRRLLVAARGIRVSGPHWSPDGAWIAYASCCDPSGYNLWLIRPDGTQDHPVVPTTVKGYPGWTIDWFANSPFWSPDARRLVVNFSAVSPDGSQSVRALGTIAREGGEVTPVWIDPPGVTCCASSFPQTWSPDGRSIIFSSGHHLAPDPEWASGKFEPGVELWMINADGTGEPTRLTYDYSRVGGASWWAPNTPVGKGVSVVKGDASLTFAQVIAQGSTRMSVTFDVPGPAPAGYSFASDLWSGATTAAHQGDVTVSLKYDDSLVGREDALALLEWNAAKGKWQEITAHPIDTVNHLIKGQCKALTTFVIAVKD